MGMSSPRVDRGHQNFQEDPRESSSFRIVKYTCVMLHMVPQVPIFRQIAYNVAWSFTCVVFCCVARKSWGASYSSVAAGSCYTGGSFPFSHWCSWRRVLEEPKLRDLRQQYLSHSFALAGSFLDAGRTSRFSSSSLPSSMSGV